MSDIKKLADITCCIGQLKERIEAKERELSESKAHAERLQNQLSEVQAEKLNALIAALTKERDALQIQHGTCSVCGYVAWKEHGNHQDCQYCAVASERDEITLRREESALANEQMLSELATSQQEVARLRETLGPFAKMAKDKWITSLPHQGVAFRTIHGNTLTAGNFYAVSSALSSTPAPVHTDTERLDWLDSQGMGKDPRVWSVYQFTGSVREAIDAEIERTKGAK